jgi:outer membrane protein
VKLRNQISLLLLLCSPVLASAQLPKLAWCDATYILPLLPEATQVEQQLQTYQASLTQVLNVKKDYFETKMGEFQEQMQAGTMPEGDQQTRMTELQRLQQDLETAAAEADQKLEAKRDELLLPLYEKIKAAIKTVATEGGFVYVFNSGILGTTIVITAPKENDITDTVLRKLGVEPPVRPAQN